MPESRSHPFTNFVLALAHSGQTFGQFTGEQDDQAIADKWGITKDQVRAVREGDLEQIQGYIAEEVGGEPVAAIWIGNIPWPWIGS